MTDNELLRLAAKAAGLIILREESDCMLISSDGCRTGYHWNPLTDDGDALRLAVKLDLLREVDSRVDDLIRDGFFPDALTATRRAIVRAAAEIGKAK